MEIVATIRARRQMQGMVVVNDPDFPDSKDRARVSVFVSGEAEVVLWLAAAELKRLISALETASIALGQGARCGLSIC